MDSVDLPITDSRQAATQAPALPLPSRAQPSFEISSPAQPGRRPRVLIQLPDLDAVERTTATVALARKLRKHAPRRKKLIAGGLASAVIAVGFLLVRFRQGDEQAVMPEAPEWDGAVASGGPEPMIGPAGGEQRMAPDVVLELAERPAEGGPTTSRATEYQTIPRYDPPAQWQSPPQGPPLNVPRSPQSVNPYYRQPTGERYRQPTGGTLREPGGSTYWPAAAALNAPATVSPTNQSNARIAQRPDDNVPHVHRVNRGGAAHLEGIQLEYESAP